MNAHGRAQGGEEVLQKIFLLLFALLFVVCCLLDAATRERRQGVGDGDEVFQKTIYKNFQTPDRLPLAAANWYTVLVCPFVAPRFE